MTKKNILLLVVMLTCLYFGVRFFSQNANRSKATASMVNLTITPNSGTIDGKKTVDLLLKGADTGKKINGFDLRFSTTGTVSITDSGTPVDFINSANADLFTQIYKLPSRIYYAVIKGETDWPSIVKIPLTVTCTGQGKGTVTIDTTTSEVSGVAPGVDYSFGTVDKAEFDCTSGTANKGQVAVGFTPNTATKLVNEDFVTKLDFTTSDPNLRIAGWDMDIAVDNDVDVVSIADPVLNFPGPTSMVKSRFDDTPSSTPAGGTGTCTKVTKAFNQTTRIITITYVCSPHVSLLPMSVSMALSLKGVKQGQGKLTIVRSQVIGSDVPTDTNRQYQVDLHDFSYAIGDGSTPTPQATGSARLTLALKLQGIVNKPTQTKSKKIKVGLFRTSMQEPIYKTGEFAVDDNGIWRGTVGFDVEPATDYIVYVKDDHGVQKKICNDTPTETFPGTYGCAKGKIMIKAGDQSFDFSKIYLLVGDLPEQDGIVNSYDIALVRNAIGKNDEESIGFADLNRDGAVNGQDFALMISALSVRQDEQ